MSASDAVPVPAALPAPPLPLSAELRADVAYRRARGASWDAVGAKLRFDADALRRAATADPLFAAALEAEWAEAVREAEAEALRRLQKLTASESEEVALRASVVVVRYATERRRTDARRTPPAPRTPPAEPKPAPVAPAVRDRSGRTPPPVEPARVVPMG
jgi:hypothetical protein